MAERMVASLLLGVFCLMDREMDSAFSKSSVDLVAADTTAVLSTLSQALAVSSQVEIPHRPQY